MDSFLLYLLGVIVRDLRQLGGGALMSLKNTVVANSKGSLTSLPLPSDFKILIKDFDSYKDELTNRLDPSMSIMQGINAKVRKNPKKVIFAEGEDENMLKAAIEFGRNRLGIPILIGAENRVKEQLKKIRWREDRFF